MNATTNASELALASAAEAALQRALALGAEEARVRVHRSEQVDLAWRDGKLDKTTEAVSQGLGVSLLVDGRFSTHSTSDLTPASVDAFLVRAVDATRVLEEDRDRRLPERERMGQADADLDLFDGRFAEREPRRLRTEVARLEQALRALDPGDLVSTTAWLWQSQSWGLALASNGFQATDRASSYGLGAELTVKEPSGRLPEADVSYSAHHLDDLPSVEAVAAEGWRRMDTTRKVEACSSGRYPMLLANRAVGRILGTLLTPMGGAALWEGRSVLEGRLGHQIAAGAFTLRDEPLIPRGVGSHLCDGDGFPARPRPVVEHGRLEMWFLGLYHARKLGLEPTTAGASNLVMAPGTRSPQDLASDLPRAILVTGFLGGNANPATGDFSFGIRGQLLERGVPVQNLAEMNVSGNILHLMERYQAAADDPWTWSAWRVPSLLFDDVQFSGS